MKKFLLLIPMLLSSYTMQACDDYPDLKHAPKYSFELKEDVYELFDILDLIDALKIHPAYRPDNKKFQSLMSYLEKRRDKLAKGVIEAKSYFKEELSHNSKTHEFAGRDEKYYSRFQEDTDE